MAQRHDLKNSWMAVNHLTMTYDTKDGTKVAVELADIASCLADVFVIESIRENQRNKMRAEKEWRSYGPKA